ncbi:hypothetical protein F5050DRAFT_1809286 [Lentinula boryana]|uniref:DEK C-terminal domain-containing protein n=1 Tax=Lentinula boryana TaxID=40481 RepID=A0ABQ8Q8D3_9AGAR|nr:hypothetical protein F5050DRAFT_1809286 [Lentinula boryana]
MPPPGIKVIGKLTREIVSDADKSGTLSKLTPRIIREKLEEDLALEDGALKQLKNVIQDAITKALEETRDDEENDEANEEDDWQEERTNVASKVETKRAARKENQKKGTEKPLDKKPSQKPLKTEPSSSDIPAKGKKRKSEADVSSSKAKKPRVSNDVKSKVKRDKEAFTSAAVVPPSSDFEDDRPTKDNIPFADKTTPRKPSSKRTPSPNEPKHDSSPGNSSKAGSPPQMEEAEKSESELSVLIDDPPKRKKKGKAKSAEISEAKEKKKTRKGAASTSLSKDEETIKRLKGLVNACGVRKVWSKVFKDVNDSPSKQIALLRKILADLGMTGRLSLEQAKTIKERREFASELADVQSFEQSITNQSSRRSRSVATKEESSEAEKDSDEENVRPAKRKTNARQSIMAFLEDQSDSE